MTSAICNRIPHLLRICCLVLAVGQFSPDLLADSSQDLSVGVAESVGMSGERLARIDSWLAGIVEERKAAGFVSLVARRGTVVHHRAVGALGMTTHEPMPLDALFDIASMTKPLTAVAALTLYERGLVSLSDPVSDHLPAFAQPVVATETGDPTPATQQMRVRHLFTHTSGVSDPRSRAETYVFPTMEAYMQEFVKLPLQAEPGSKWIYGDSLDVLGYLVETVSGQGLDEYLQANVLSPLGMKDTHYWPPDSKQSRRAQLVVNGKDDPERLSREPVEAAARKTFIAGASGLQTTAADYWRFCQMLLNGGILNGHRVLGPRTVHLIADNHLDPGTTFRPGLDYGLGFAVVSDRAASGLPYSAGSYYWGGSQGTVFWIDPAEDLIGILMVQVRPSGDLRLRLRFAAQVYSAIVD